MFRFCACALALGCAVSVAPAYAAAITLDFETEDDFVTPLVNGQAIATALADAQPGDTVLEFGNLVKISSAVLGGGSGHLGPAIFDSNPLGPNKTALDKDLLVGLGNILILQESTAPATTVDPTYGLLFTSPNDEGDPTDRGSFIFDFLKSVELVSIDLIDIDGGTSMDIVMTDLGGKIRTYSVPLNWTNDVRNAPLGYDTLFLNSLSPQDGEGSGGFATATEDVGFDATTVTHLEIVFGGTAPSGGIDNLVFVPEASSLALSGMVFGAGLGVFGWRSRRRSA